MSYTELQTTTNFSFLRGASHPEELVKQAGELGYKHLAITDRNTFAGIVRAHVAAKEHGIRLIPGCRLDLLDGPSLLAYPTGQDAWSRLSSLLTTGNLRAEKGQCHLYKADVYTHAKDINFIIVPPSALNPAFELDPDFQTGAEEYREALGKTCHLAASRSYLGDDTKRLFRLSQLATRLDMPLVATNDVHYHLPGRRQLQDVLTCIREKCTIQTAGFRLYENAERHLKPIPEMLRLFRQYPDAIRSTGKIAEASLFSLDMLRYVYPEELTTEGRTPQEIFDSLPKGVSTPELKIPFAEGEHYMFIERFQKKAAFDGARVTTIDGVRADWPDGWGLVRASNTTPVLVLRFDADTDAALKRIQDAFRTQLTALDPNLKLPF